MVDFDEIVSRLSSQEQEDTLGSYIKSTGDQVVSAICNGSIKIVEFVESLNLILTNRAYEIRSNGVKLLAHVITLLPNELLNGKEIELLTEFMCLRLLDHKTMEGPALVCLNYFVDCSNKPEKYNKQIVDFIKTKSNVHRMEAKNRRKIYELLKKVVAEKRRLSTLIDGELVYSLVSILEGENNPDNLLICFSIISFIFKNFSELEPYIDDIFEWLSSYYPVDYTPSEKDESAVIDIQRSDLVQALYDCFFATPLNSDNLQTLLLEKLDSNVVSTKLESLECLIKCYEQFPLSSITKYNSTLWSAIRMNCLKKVASLDPKLMEVSLKALSSLSKRLSKDDEQYFVFVSDMYEELAIAFRKPEMDLFEPAAKLLTHAVLPSIVGFNYILDKILTVSMSALEAEELRPLSGLAYMFEQLHKHHPDEVLKQDLNESIKALLMKVLDTVKLGDENSLILIESLVCHRVALKESDLDEIITKLRELEGTTTIDIERCLALVSLYYKRPDIICYEELTDYGLKSLIQLVHSFEPDELIANKLETKNSSFPTSLSKFSVYMRLLMMELDRSRGLEIDSIDQHLLNQCLVRMREIASALRDRRLTERIATIHSIILNKIEPQNVNKILMDIFTSDYCQKLVPADKESHSRTIDVYLPLIMQVFKSIVVRNHQLASPLINLFLNFITSDKVDLQLALDGSRIFSFVHSSDSLLMNHEHHYRIFYLYRQKFYAQTKKEIRLRHDKQMDDIRKDLLLFTIALQVPHLPIQVYQADYEWLVRQLLGVLSKHYVGKSEEKTVSAKTEPDQIFFKSIFGCLENLIQKDLSQNLVNFLSSLIDLCLKIAHYSSSLQDRRQALVCLTKIAVSFDETDLLVFRSQVVDQLRSCLADKKRLVRQAAADARLRWIIIGQPIGSI